MARNQLSNSPSDILYPIGIEILVVAEMQITFRTSLRIHHYYAAFKVYTLRTLYFCLGGIKNKTKSSMCRPQIVLVSIAQTNDLFKDPKHTA